MGRNRKWYILSILLLLCACIIPFQSQIRHAVLKMINGKKSVEDRVAEYGDVVHARLAPIFERVGVMYPPQKIALIGLKSERMLEVWVASADGVWKHLKDYPILGMSGKLGPKLKEGDRQVPEGIYSVESLNPNSLYHLALRVGYPNEEDRKRAAQEGRTDLGSDIMIHGKNCSIGCLAMGDEAAEDLFVLAAETGIQNVTVVLSPVDFRIRDLPQDHPTRPSWCDELYATIRTELEKLQR
jgi:hypothetical protein